MFRVLTCLAVQHDFRMVALAGILCFLSSYVAMTLLQRARRARARARTIWLATAGAAGGFGIWATHFVAMLAYEPGVLVGYAPALTLISLVISVLTTCAAVSCATYVPGKTGFLAAGLLFGVGVASMHFVGMTAIDMPGTIAWDRDLVIAAIVLAILFAVPAFYAALNFKRRLAASGTATLLMTLGVVVMHFTAMGALFIVPSDVAVDPVHLLSPLFMVVTIATVSFSLLLTGLAAAIFAIRAENITTASEARFKMLVQGVTDYAIYMLDTEGRVSNWNAGAERAKGYSADEIVGRDFSVFYREEDREKGLPQNALEMARTHGKFEAEGWRCRKDGTAFWASVAIEAIYDEDRQFVGYAKITKDITKEKADADRIRAVSHNLDVALENMSQGICLFDHEEKLVISNRRYGQIFGFPEGFVRPGLTYREIVETGYRLVHPDPAIYKPKAAEHYERNKAAVRAGQGTLSYKLQQGNFVQANYNAMPDGGWVVTFEDITERLLSEEKLAFMARHDGLTGLPNRAEFNEYLAQEMAIAKRTSSKLAVIGIDLDKFKEINDQQGHAAGDQVLVTLAQRMGAMLVGDEMVARFGGDEFAAIKRFADLAELHDFIGRLETCLFADMNIEGFEIKPGASMGVALYPQDASTAELLLANADLAMYRAKNALKQNVCFYEVAMDEAARSRRSLANDLWAAVERQQLHLNYQIQKSVASGETTGYEVLLRWTHPQFGNIPPMDFITLAEECGAILPIGEWVLREACREAAGWPEPHKIAVNLSPVQLGHVDMAALVHAVLLETGLSPKRLELEITESSIITDKERALHTLRQIKNLGVSIAIDDFGTGYSSLETLRTFPFDKIKLDRSFMTEVEDSPQAKAIIRAILALGRSLDIPVLAEGVETQVQLDILIQEGCDEAQGYLLGRPTPVGGIGKAGAASVADAA